jgi:lipopolysaccharide biosynthesis regulator YciM
MAKRMIAPDKRVAETTIGNRSYKPNRSGVYTVSDHDAKAMKAEGFFEASLMGATLNTNLGYTCNECGFGSWFKKCGRCGHESSSETNTDGD